MTEINITVDKKKRRNAKVFEKSVLQKFPKSKNLKRKKIFKILGIILAVLFSLILVIGIWGYFKLYIPGMKIKDQAFVVLDVVYSAKEDFDNQDLVAMQEHLTTLEIELVEMDGLYHEISFLENFPFVKGYYKNGEYIIDSAKLSIPLGQDLLVAANPIADVFGYSTSEGSHEEVSGQEKVQTMIRNLPDISAVLEDSESQIDQILESLAKIDPDYIPKELKGIPLREYFLSIDDSLNEGKSIFADIQEILDLIPFLAGADGKKTYLILFQNDMEIRPTGGFITAFGYAEIENGMLGDIESEDIYNLDKKIYSWEKAPEEVIEYLGVYEWHIRDVNIYTDLVSSSLKFEEMYANQYAPRDFDGIIYIDTGFVESLISVIGPIELEKYNETITADNVVSELELYSERVLTGGSDRKQFMEDLMEVLVLRVIEARREEWGGLIDAAWTSLESKSLQLYFHDEKAQSLASKYGFTGEVQQDVEGDYLYIVESNMGGLKSNMYVMSDVVQTIETQEDGTINKTVKIHWENPEPKDYWLNGPYRNWVRIYVPQGSELISGAVSEREVNSEWNESDYNKTVFEAFVTVPVATGCSYYDEEKECDPGVLDLEFTYKLPFTIEDHERFSLYIQKQPGILDQLHTIWYNNVRYDEILSKDLDLELD